MPHAAVKRQKFDLISHVNASKICTTLLKHTILSLIWGKGTFKDYVENWNIIKQMRTVFSRWQLDGDNQLSLGKIVNYPRWLLSVRSNNDNNWDGTRAHDICLALASTAVRGCSGILYCHTVFRFTYHQPLQSYSSVYFFLGSLYNPHLWWHSDCHGTAQTP